MKIKEGYKTTEFWLTAIGFLANLFFSIKGYIPTEISVKYGAILIAVYNLARAIAKATATPKDDEIIEKIDKVIKNAKK